MSPDHFPRPLVLVAEDEVLIRDLIEAALEDGGFAVVLANTGAEAIAVIDARSGELAALVTDVDLGSGPTGWDVARHGRDGDPNLPIIYMSGGSPHRWTAEGLPNSVMLSKPFAPAQLVVALAAQMNAAEPGG